MCCTQKNCINSRNIKKRVIALIFLVCFVIVSLLPEVFILTHANHDHDRKSLDNSCSICAKIQDAESILKQFRSATKITVFALFMHIFSILVLTYFRCQAISLTLVALKVRMNN